MVMSTLIVMTATVNPGSLHVCVCQYNHTVFAPLGLLDHQSQILIIPKHWWPTSIRDTNTRCHRCHRAALALLAK